MRKRQKYTRRKPSDSNYEQRQGDNSRKSSVGRRILPRSNSQLRMEINIQRDVAHLGVPRRIGDRCWNTRTLIKPAATIGMYSAKWFEGEGYVSCLQICRYMYKYELSKKPKKKAQLSNLYAHEGHPGYRRRPDAAVAYQKPLPPALKPHSFIMHPDSPYDHMTIHFAPFSFPPSSPTGLSQLCPSLLPFLNFLVDNHPFFVGALSNLSAGPIL